MKNTSTIFALFFVLLLAGLPNLGQAQPWIPIQYFRPYDQYGLNTFEATKLDTVAYDGFKLRLGAAFTQQFQMLDHENAANPRMLPDTQPGSTYNANELMEIGAGFNLATANLNLDAQLAEGVRVNLTAYLSSRHHPETWVKAGYIQADELPFFRSAAVDRIMDYVTLRVGHMEVNYGDAHFRRTDNGNAMYNPLVGNYIMDSFATEIGAEVYVRSGALLGMVGITDGEIQGNVTRPDDRSPSLYGKLGFDNQFSDALRLRLTGSVYTTSSSINNTLYAGDRAGSRYYLVLENTKAAVASQFRSGRMNPVLGDEVTSFMLNPFIKFGGLELFGVIEQASGRAASETDNRTWNQYAVEGVYRFMPREQLYVAARYNTVSGTLIGSGADVSVDRIQIGGGWFATPNILLKLEYVTQTYNDFPANDILHEGKFNGLMIEGVVAF